MAHLLPKHLPTALANFVVQSLLHAPQCKVEVVVSVSHPGDVVQSPQPLVQLMPQLPPEQVAVPLVPLHTVVQSPQWVGSSSTYVSQPAAAVQSPQPVLQLAFGSQLPVVQEACALGSAVQGLPQLPQLVSVVVLVSQPLAGS